MSEIREVKLFLKNFGDGRVTRIATAASIVTT
jgi:hypothetical protein